MANDRPPRLGDRSLFIRSLMLFGFSLLGCGLVFAANHFFHGITFSIDAEDTKPKIVFPVNFDESPPPTMTSSEILDALKQWKLWLFAAITVVFEYWLPFMACCCCCCQCFSCCPSERKCIGKETLELMVIQLIVALPVFFALQLLKMIWIRLPLEFVFLQISYFLFAIIGEKCGLEETYPSLIFYFYRYGCSCSRPPVEVCSKEDDAQLENGSPSSEPSPPPPDDSSEDAANEETPKCKLLGSGVKILPTEDKTAHPKKKSIPGSMEEQVRLTIRKKKTPRSPPPSYNAHCENETTV